MRRVAQISLSNFLLFSSLACAGCTTDSGGPDGFTSLGGDSQANDETSPGESSGLDSGSESSGTGDGDDTGSTEASTGAGDGDGDTSTSGGDGDGDPSTSSSSGGDGDGDPSATSSSGGDGDGDPSTSTSSGGDGDGDPSTSDTGSSDSTDTTGGGDGDGDTSGETGSGSNMGCERMDIVFVVDISASMNEENDNIAANFNSFIDVLDDHVAADNGFNSYRIGVTSSSINGSFGGCNTTMGLDGSLHDGDGWGGGCPSTPELWLDGPGAGVAADFSCYADNPIPSGGGSDCGKEMPLAAIEAFGDKLAPGGYNEGFYSVDDNSLLVFVIITDEDEDALSATNPTQTKLYLDQLAGGEGRYGVIVLAGPGPSGCSGTYGDAQYADTLESFTELVPNGYFDTICTPDLYLGVQNALQDMVVVCESIPLPE